MVGRQQFRMFCKQGALEQNIKHVDQDVGGACAWVHIVFGSSHVIHFQRVDWWFQLFFSHYVFMEMGKLSQLTFISYENLDVLQPRIR